MGYGKSGKNESPMFLDDGGQWQIKKDPMNILGEIKDRIDYGLWGTRFFVGKWRVGIGFPAKYIFWYRKGEDKSKPTQILLAIFAFQIFIIDWYKMCEIAAKRCHQMKLKELDNVEVY